MRLVNLTPHDVTIVRDDGTSLTLPKCDRPCRVITSVAPSDTIVDGITIGSESSGPVQSLPDPRDGVLYLVSRMVALRACGANYPGGPRADLVVPGDPIRDAEGAIIGARGLLWGMAY